MAEKLALEALIPQHFVNSDAAHFLCFSLQARILEVHQWL
jgi:hypothetical protein